MNLEEKIVEKALSAVVFTIHMFNIFWENILPKKLSES